MNNSTLGYVAVNRENVEILLGTSRLFVQEMLKGMYARQTETEQTTATTRNDNARGFNMRDAKFGTSLVNWMRSGRDLTESQWRAAGNMLRKYAGRQLLEIACETGWGDVAEIETDTATFLHFYPESPVATPAPAPTYNPPTTVYNGTTRHLVRWHNGRGYFNTVRRG